MQNHLSLGGGYAPYVAKDVVAWQPLTLKILTQENGKKLAV